MLQKFEQFIGERQYLKNVSNAMLEWYKYSLKWLRTESPTEDELKGTVLRMREKGLKETGCKRHWRLQRVLHWSTAGANVKCGAGCKHPRIPQLKEPQIILPTLTEAQVLACGLEAQGQDLLATAFASTDSFLAGYGLSNQGGAER